MTSIVKSVEAVTISMSTSEASKTVTLTKSQTTSMCIPVVDGATQSTGSADSRRSQVDVEFTSTEVIVTRESTNSLAWNGVVYVWEFDTGVGVTIQQGTFTILDNQQTFEQAITSVTLAESAAFFYFIPPVSATNSSSVDIQFNSATELGFHRYGGIDPVDGHWYVIEADTFTTQEVVVEMSSTTEDTTISAVVLADTFVWSSAAYNSSDRNGETIGTHVSLSTTTNLSWVREDGSVTLTVGSYIVECDSNEFAVQAFEVDADGEGTSTTTAITSIDQTRSSVHHSNKLTNKTSDGGSPNADLSKSWAWSSFSASDEVTTSYGEAISTGNPSLTEFYVVQWELTAAPPAVDEATFAGFNF